MENYFRAGHEKQEIVSLMTRNQRRTANRCALIPSR